MSASQKLTNAYKCVDDYKLFNPLSFEYIISKYCIFGIIVKLKFIRRNTGAI